MRGGMKEDEISHGDVKSKATEGNQRMEGRMDGLEQGGRPRQRLPQDFR